MGERRVMADGRILEMQPDGTIVQVGGPQQGGAMTYGTPDPSIAAKQAITQNQAAASQYDPALAAADLAAKQRAAAAAQTTANATASKEARDQAKFTQEQGAEDSTLSLLGRGIDQLQTIYDRSFEGKGLQSIAEYAAPSNMRPDNQNLNETGNNLSSTIARALQLTGQQFNTPAEAAMFIGGMLPKNTDPDEVVQRKIRDIQAIYENGARVRAQATGQPYQPTYDLETGTKAAPQQSDRSRNLNDYAAPGARPQQEQFARDGASITDRDRQVQAAMQQAIDQGADYQTVVGMARQLGYDAPEGLQEYMADPRNAGRPARIGTPETGESMGVLGNAITSAPGAAATMFVNGTTMGGVDELGGMFGGPGTQEAIDAAKGMMREESPYASFAGEMAGTVLPMLGTSALIGKAVPMLSAGKAAMLGDTAVGAAYGAGETNENRAGGALAGALSGAAGSALGQGIAKFAGRAIAPTGGSSAPLYAEGVRPTIGQRVADKGVIGSAVNKVEEGMQSLPLVGNMVTQARQGARDQYETGAFNRALREIGGQLPPDAERGPEAFRYAGQAFDQAYDSARGGMQFAPDMQFGQDIGQIQQDYIAGGLLDSESIKQFEKTIATTVGSRMRGGAMTGDIYKKTVSDLGKKIAATSKPELQSALKSFRDAMDGAARRSSNPEAVAAMDAADRGYAQYKPLQKAQERAGSDAGRFSPKQLEATERMGMGKTRAYREGNTIMGDYISAGRNLNDTLPNSGTADRVMNAGGLGAVGGAAFIDPTLAMTMLGSTLPYAPGIRNMSALAMAPRKNPALRKLGNEVYNLSPYGGAAGASLALPFLAE